MQLTSMETEIDLLNRQIDVTIDETTDDDERTVANLMKSNQMYHD